MDADGTISIPWWLSLVIKVIPSPWGDVVRAIVRIIDMLPQPHQEAVLGSLALAAMKDDSSLFTDALHKAVHDVTDRIK